ncbi:MAG: Fic family protein [Candidatus Levybacteria bacterium]|nr:Fic family protein [Candidatus Levybacteria bacterium]
MNDSILTPRQKYILNLISQSEGLLREQIQNEIQEIYPSSKPTLVRDLNILLKYGFIKFEGKARATKYLPKVLNRLLRKFDTERYFADDPDKRIGARKTFDFKILEDLHDLFLQDEMEVLKKICRSFKQQTSKLNPDLLKRELERFAIELSWKSSKIEGNTYTLLETESLIKEQKEAVGKTKEEAIMILNHKIAFEEILKNKDDFSVISITQINQLHNILIKDLNVTSGIRKQAVGITGTAYQPLDNEHQIREVFEKTISIINRTKNPFEKALIAQFMIAYIQPYSDGNKRTARMFTNAILLAHDLYPLSYRSVDEDSFKKGLILFYEQSSICEIKQLFIEQVIFANETYFR